MNKLYNSQVYERLKKLYLTLGIDVENNNENDAEIYCYSRVIDKIKNEIGVTLEKLFCSSIDNIDMYIELLNIDPTNKSYDVLVKEIKERLSMNFGEFKKLLFDKALAEIGSGSYTISGKYLAFEGIKREDLPKLHRFIESWNIFFSRYNYKSKNRIKQNFDEWDSWQENWAYYDSLKLCWNFLETYKEDI